METHTCLSTDGITFTCPICGRSYTWIYWYLVVTKQGNPDVVHKPIGVWGITVDATVPNSPARPELFGKN